MKQIPMLLAGEVSTDTVECLSELLEQARKGDIVGLAFAAIMKRSNYAVHTTGEARRNPTFARGMIAALDDKLSDAIHTGHI